jgi:polar amino acid transport system substrate-binding protein
MKNLKLTLLAGFAALMVSSAFSTAALADGRLEQILNRGKLLVGTGTGNPPWHFRNEAGDMAGFDVDIAKIVAKGMFGDDTKIEFINQASDARIPNLVTDKVDITCQFMTVTAERAQQVNFTLPYYREGVGLMMAAGGKYKSHEELKAAGSAVTVSVLQNVYAEDMVHYALPEAKVDQYDSIDLGYQALNSGRADAVATDMSSLQWFMKQNPGKYVDSGYGWGPQSYSCAVKKGDQDFLNFVNTTLHEAMTGVEFGTYSASFENWFGIKPPEPKIGFPSELQ